MCKFRLLTVCCCLLVLLPSMALAPIENTNNKDTRDIFFHFTNDRQHMKPKFYHYEGTSTEVK